MSQTKRQQALVRAAEARAKIVALLNRERDGEPVTVGAMLSEVDGLGYSHDELRSLVSRMIGQRLIRAEAGGFVLSTEDPSPADRRRRTRKGTPGGDIDLDISIDPETGGLVVRHGRLVLRFNVED